MVRMCVKSHARLSFGIRGLEIVPSLHLRAGKAVIRPRISTILSEPLFLSYVIRSKISCAGSIYKKIGCIICSISVKRLRLKNDFVPFLIFIYLSFHCKNSLLIRASNLHMYSFSLLA